MPSIIKILLCGHNGAMGKVVQSCLPNGMQIVAGVADKTTEEAFEQATSIEDIQSNFDIILDFSHVSLMESILDFAVAKKKPLVIATSGITEELHKKIDAASKIIPIVQAGNYSLGVYAVQETVKKLASILSDFDLEIVEKHHRYKKDSPSGTAEMLFEALNESRGNLKPIFGRGGQYPSKPANEVGYHSLRAGTIVGEHSVIMAGEDEVVEIKHSAFSKKIFAMGAFKAIRYVVEKQNGRYTLKDVIENA